MDHNNSKESNSKKTLNKSELVSIAFQLGFIIAIPLILFGLGGKWIDQKIGTYPVFSIISIFLAMVFTSVWIYKKFRIYFDNSNESGNSKNISPNKPKDPVKRDNDSNL